MTLSTRTSEFKDVLMQQARIQSDKYGPGMLIVSTIASDPPTYVLLDNIQPAALQSCVRKMHKEDGNNYCFVGMKDDKQIHVAKVWRRQEPNIAAPNAATPHPSPPRGP